MEKTVHESEVRLAEDGLPETALIPRNGQVIVTPKTIKKSNIIRTDGQMGELMYERVAVVLAVGPGHAAMMTGTRVEMDLERGDYVLMVCSDTMPDGSMKVSDPSVDGLLLLAVDERSIVAKVEREVIDRLRAEALAAYEKEQKERAERQEGQTDSGIILSGE